MTLNDRIKRTPYDWQRIRHRLGEYPRPPQPNTNQPNRKPVTIGWGTTNQDYWNNVFTEYLNRRRNNPSLGGLK